MRIPLIHIDLIEDSPPSSLYSSLDYFSLICTMRMTVSEVSEIKVILDASHHLAGKKLIFNIA